jgi:hypothetical protein
VQQAPGAPAFEFAGARSLGAFEGASSKFMEVPELPPKKNEKGWNKIHIVKFRWNQKSTPFTRSVKSAAPKISKSFRGWRTRQRGH